MSTDRIIHLEPLKEAVDDMYDGLAEIVLVDNRIVLRSKINKKNNVSIEVDDYMGYMFFEELIENFNRLLAKQYLKEQNKKK
jgi:mannitol-specific phosphotransferase system IIBC component